MKRSFALLNATIALQKYLEGPACTIKGFNIPDEIYHPFIEAIKLEQEQWKKEVENSNLRTLFESFLQTVERESKHPLPKTTKIIWSKDPEKEECDRVYRGITLICTPTVMRPKLVCCSGTQAQIFEELVEAHGIGE